MKGKRYDPMWPAGGDTPGIIGQEKRVSPGPGTGGRQAGRQDLVLKIHQATPKMTLFWES